MCPRYLRWPNPGLNSLPDGMTHLGRQKARSWMKENGIKMKAIDSRLSRTQSYSLAGMSTGQIASKGKASLTARCALEEIIAQIIPRSKYRAIIGPYLLQKWR